MSAGDVATRHRWIASVTYRSKAGPVTVEHDLVELYDIHDLVEKGPNWDCIVGIDIQRTSPIEPGLTVEKAVTQ